jgi:tetratricopeptide (TPR) repeat protein
MAPEEEHNEQTDASGRQGSRQRNLGYVQQFLRGDDEGGGGDAAAAAQSPPTDQQAQREDEVTNAEPVERPQGAADDAAGAAVEATAGAAAEQTPPAPAGSEQARDEQAADAPQPAEAPQADAGAETDAAAEGGREPSGEPQAAADGDGQDASGGQQPPGGDEGQGEDEVDQEAIEQMIAARAARRQAERAQAAAGGKDQDQPPPQEPQTDGAAEQQADEAGRAVAESAEQQADAQQAGDGKAAGEPPEAPAGEKPAEAPAGGEPPEAPAGERAAAQQPEGDRPAAEAEGAEAPPSQQAATPAEEAIDQMIAAEVAGRRTAPADAAPEAGEDAGQADEQAPAASTTDGGEAPPDPAAAAAALVGALDDADIVGRSSIARRIPLIQTVLLINTVLILVIVSVLVMKRSSAPRQARGHVSHVSQGPGGDQPPAPQGQTTEQLPVETRRVTSWPEAEKAYAQAQYGLAVRRYMQLLEIAEELGKNPLFSDFLRLRIGQCLVRSGRGGEAEALLIQVGRSPSPVVAAVAHYELAKHRCAEGEHLRARALAYRAIASLGMLETSLSLRTDCEFLIARALSERALSFVNPEDRLSWPEKAEIDLFGGLSESDLRTFLEEGATYLRDAEWGPSVRTVGPAQVRVQCLKVPLQELLKYLASETGVDVAWAAKASPLARSRPVSLNLRRIPVQALAETACGMVDLIARYDGRKIYVYDPRGYDSINAQRELFVREAISVWRLLLLRAQADPRVPHGHLAVGRLLEIGGKPQDALHAMREYQIVVTRFPRDRAAAEALFRSAKLRMALRDYPGAMKDLNDLIDGYPWFKADDLYLQIGTAALQAGLPKKAVDVFIKLYHENVSLESRAAACLGAGRCFWQLGERKEAATWLKRYVGLAQQPSDDSAPQQPQGGRGGDELPQALLLLARIEAAEARPAEAIQYLYRGMATKPSRPMRVELSLEMARAQLAGGNYVRAVGALKTVASGPLTREQALERLLLTTRTYREMGFASEAAAMLRKEMPSARAGRERGRVGLALARCLAEGGETDEAVTAYADVLGDLEPLLQGPAAACELAELCIEAGNVDRAIAVLDQALRSQLAARAKGEGGAGADLAEQLRQRACRVLGRCYTLRQQYGKATVAFSGRIPGQMEQATP